MGGMWSLPNLLLILGFRNAYFGALSGPCQDSSPCRQQVRNKLTTSLLSSCTPNVILETTRHNRHNGLLPAPTCYGLFTDLLRRIYGETGVMEFWPSATTNGVWLRDKLPIFSLPLTPKRNVNPNRNQSPPTQPPSPVVGRQLISYTRL